MRTRILHVTGPCCSGKSHVIRQLSSAIRVQTWDVAAARGKAGSTKAALPGLRAAASKFSSLVVESSGQNRQLNSELYKLGRVTTVPMAAPSAPEVKARSASRGMAATAVDSFNRRFMWPEGVNQAQALATATAWANSSR